MPRLTTRKSSSSLPPMLFCLPEALASHSQTYTGVQRAVFMLREKIKGQKGRDNQTSERSNRSLSSTKSSSAFPSTNHSSVNTAPCHIPTSPPHQGYHLLRPQRHTDWSIMDISFRDQSTSKGRGMECVSTTGWLSQTECCQIDRVRYFSKKVEHNVL